MRKKDKTPEEILRFLTVPIYDLPVMLSVSHDLTAVRKQYSDTFGEVDDSLVYDAMCSYSNGRFALFFTHDTFTTKIVAHEVFHLTHRILDWVGAPLDSNHHEHAALLHGYLMDWVVSQKEIIS